MHSSFALDLKTVRHRSGLTQYDCAYLLGITKRRVGALETGKTLPSVPEIVGLSLIFGRSFKSLFDAVSDDMRSEMAERLATLPDTKRNWRSQFNRHHLLIQLTRRLEDNGKQHV